MPFFGGHSKLLLQSLVFTIYTEGELIPVLPVNAKINCTYRLVNKLQLVARAFMKRRFCKLMEEFVNERQKVLFFKSLKNGLAVFE